MKTYLVRIQAIGYESIERRVQAKSIRSAEWRVVLKEWCELNDVPISTGKIARVEVKAL